jgi:integrase
VAGTLPRPGGAGGSKSFARKIDAERFLVSVEDAKLRGAYVDPAAGEAQGDALPDRRQVEALAEAIEPPYGVLVRVAAYTGLRPCEYVALKVGRLDQHLPRHLRAPVP